ncbi:hypothetical protein EHS25_006207 [Saitozyma podzolica]|uniref:Uncharacterized protein n=1 Tax=Saitozyma podzolica TaxID=1890683 RepID=A0A427XRZ4_9TREE|nr:hypothetical protein EHS25_006207 [Saitozyma podzolica]
MSLSSTPTSSLSHDEPDTAAPVPARRTIALTVPTSLLVLPASAAIVGMIIGMSRGGSRARLRFLAENAHRPPTTVQGWYFYTKTRNYRVFFAAARTGARYALGLGGATAAYVLLDESVGWTREQVFGAAQSSASTSIPAPPAVPDATDAEPGSSRRIGWREGPVRWEDGAIAGGVMGAVVGTAYRLPRPLFFRAVLIGSIMGGATSGLQIAQDHVRKLKEKDERVSVSGESGGSGLAQPVSAPVMGSAPEHPTVDRPVQAGETAMSPVQGASRALPTAAESDRLRRRAWWDPRRWVGM